MTHMKSDIVDQIVEIEKRKIYLLNEIKEYVQDKEADKPKLRLVGSYGDCILLS